MRQTEAIDLVGPNRAIDQLRDALLALRGSNNAHLRAAGAFWCATFGAIAALELADGEHRSPAPVLFAAGSEAWLAFLAEELRLLKTARSESTLAVHRLSRAVAACRAALAGDRRKPLRAHVDQLSRLLDAAKPLAIAIDVVH